MIKKFVAGVVILLLFNVNVFALGFLGPPTAELEKGQFSFGYNFTHINADLDNTSVVETDYINGVFDTVDPPGKMKIHNYKVLRNYATLGYGIMESLEANLQLGVADVKLDRWYLDEPYWMGMNFDNDLTWGFGTKFTFKKDETIAWGASIQMNFLDTDWDDVTDDVTRCLNIESYDLFLAIGATCDLGYCKLYGGPFYHYMDGDYTMTETGVTGPDNWTDIGKADIGVESVGGFAGCQIDIKDNINTTLEFSMTGDGWGVGAGVAFKY